MEKHEMELPRYVVVGRGLEYVLAERLLKNGFRRAVMTTSRTPYRLYGSRIVEACGGDVEVETLVVDDVVEEFEDAVRRAKQADVVLGVGGGRVGDVSKTLAEVSGKPFFSAPTVASHDGIASPMTSFRRDGQAYSRKSVMPSEVFADMDVISLAPRRYLLSGCGDLVAKQSAVRDWWLSHRVSGEYYGRYAAHLAYLSSTVVMKSTRLVAEGLLEGVRTVVEALISAGVAMGVAGSSRPCSGSEHLIAHSLEMLMDRPALHGERCGVATIFTSYLQRGRWRRIRESLAAMGAHHKLEHINVDADLFVEAVHRAPEIRRERYTILHHLKPTRRDVLKALEETELV
ncbi:MAG: iron-containing alcohol dehydrogenase [Candidatus Caldarchaeum sp.]